MAEAGYEVAAVSDIAEAHALVERLVGPPVASVETLQAVQSHSTCSLFVMREEGRLTGLYAELALAEAGLKALESGAFNGLDPDLGQVARPGDRVAAFYCWGLAADTRRSQVNGVRAVIAARDKVYPDLPFFTTAAGSDGARVAFRRFGCTYYPGQPRLLYSSRSLKAGNVAA
jgi:hypothetical protein